MTLSIMIVFNILIVIVLGLLARFVKIGEQDTKGGGWNFNHTTSDLIILAVVGAIAGVVNTGTGIVWAAANSAGGPLAGAALQGAFMWSYLLAYFLVRKPGSMLIVGLLETAMEALLGNPSGVATMGWGVTQGLGAEAVIRLDELQAAVLRIKLRHLDARNQRRRAIAAFYHDRFAALGVACSVQFSHAPSDRDLADLFWEGGTDGAYAFRSLWDSGALIANGSDAPVEELDPLAGIRAGVLRTIDERPAWRPERRLTVEEALVATTVNPAWLSGDERQRGKLLPGCLADLVVLSRDPLDCPPEELETVDVVATMVGGRWVHNPPPW